MDFRVIWKETGSMYILIVTHVNIHTHCIWATAQVLVHQLTQTQLTITHKHLHSGNDGQSNVSKTFVFVAMLMIYTSNSEIALLSPVCLISLNRVCTFRDALSYAFRGAKNLIFMKSELSIHRWKRKWMCRAQLLISQ